MLPFARHARPGRRASRLAATAAFLLSLVVSCSGEDAPQGAGASPGTGGAGAGNGLGGGLVGDASDDGAVPGGGGAGGGQEAGVAGDDGGAGADGSGGVGDEAGADAADGWGDGGAGAEAEAGPDAEVEAGAEAGADAAPDAPPGCSADADCAGAPGAPVCDTSTATCVECLPGNDPCPTGSYCAGSACAAGCADDGDCTGSTVCDVAKNQCVGCVADGDCAPGTVCNGGTCVAGCTAQQPCGGGLACCGGQCVDTAVSTEHCGACGAACAAAPQATMACAAGECAIGSCAGGYADCNGTASDGCEVNTASAIAHCGGCGNGCAPPNATPSCSAGSCGIAACQTGFANCNGSTGDGCEINTTNNVAHCGGCGAACPSAGGTPNCVNSVCGVSSCSPGLGDCDGIAANGCETSLGNDPQNCGGCGVTCSGANGTPSCSAGACAIQCHAGYGNCDGQIANGCETATSSNPQHCGGCGAVCSTNHGTPSCAGGACGITCDTSYGNCDGNLANGCEVDLGSDLSHCGACGGACPAQNATPWCSAGACGFTCAAGFDDCDGAPGNACETSLTTTTDCGACGVGCSLPNANATCGGGTCAVGACHASYGNCDAIAANGCETPLKASPHCGACGVTCSASQACISSACINCTTTTYTFDASDEGFSKEALTYVYSEVAWDPVNKRVLMISDRRDAGDEVFRRTLASSLNTNSTFTITSKWRATTQGNWQGAFPIFVAAAGVTNIEANGNVLGIVYSSRDSNLSQPPRYYLRYRDAGGTARLNTEYVGTTNTEYTFVIDYSGETKLLTLKIRNAANTLDLATATYTVGSVAGDGFAVDKIGMASDGTGNSMEPATQAWIDTITIKTCP